MGYCRFLQHILKQPRIFIKKQRNAGTKWNNPVKIL